MDEKPLRPPAHLALAARFQGVQLAHPRSFASAMKRADIHFHVLKAAKPATLAETRKELRPLVGALEKLKASAAQKTAVQRRAIAFAEACAGQSQAGLAEFLEFIPKAEQIFRKALKADQDTIREVPYDITHGKSNKPLNSLVAGLEKVHEQFLGEQIPANEFVLWALNEQLKIQNDSGAGFSKAAVRQLRSRAAKAL